MFRKNQTSLKKARLFIMLIPVLLVMVGSCPMKRLLVSLASVDLEMSHSPQMANTAKTISCSVEKRASGITMDLKKPAEKTLADPFLSSSTLAFFSGVIARRYKSLGYSDNTRPLCTVPLYLRKSSFII